MGSGSSGARSEAPDSSAKSIPRVTLPFAPPAAEGDGPAQAGFTAFFRHAPNPLLQVELFRPWRGKVAVADGEGGMWLYHPATGGYCLADFREWWNPRRIVKE